MFNIFKKKKETLGASDEGEFSFDDDDFGDPFGGMDDENRSPKEKFLADFKTGVKDHLKSRNFFKTVLGAALPKEMEEVIGFAENIESDITNAYSNATLEIKPKLQNLRKAVVKATPKNFSFFSKSLQEKIEKIREDDASQSGYDKTTSPEQQQTDTINQGIQSIFGTQMETQTEQFQVEQSERLTDRAVSSKQFKITSGISADIASNVARLANYTTGVTHKYHIKSLEVSHRQLFALRDLIAITKLTSSRTEENLKSIVRLSGTPDALKLREYDARNTKKIGLFQSYGVDTVLSSFRTRLEKGTKEIIGKIGAGVGMAEMGLDTMGGGMGPGIGSTIGGGAVNLLTKKLTKKFGGKLRDTVMGNSTIKGHVDNVMKKYGELPSYFSDLATDAHSLSGGGGVFSDAARGVLKAFMPKPEEGTYLGENSMSGLGEVFKYTKRTDITLNEVIPGLLTRMERQLRFIRNPKTRDTDLLKWSYQSGSFSNDKAIEKELEAAIVGDANKSYGVVNQTDEFIDNAITHKSSGMDLLDVDAPERKALQKLLLEGSSKSKRFNTESLLTDTVAGKKLSTENPELYEKVRELLDKTIGGMSGGRHMKTSKAYYDLASRIPDIKDKMKLQLDAGQLQAMKKIGIVKEVNGKVSLDKDKYIEMLTSAGRTKEKEKTGFEGLGKKLRTFFGDDDLDDPYKGSMDHMPGKSILNHEEGSAVEKDKKPEEPKSLLGKAKSAFDTVKTSVKTGYQDISDHLNTPENKDKVAKATKSVMSYIEKYTPAKIKQLNQPKPDGSASDVSKAKAKLLSTVDTAKGAVENAHTVIAAKLTAPQVKDTITKVTEGITSRLDKYIPTKLKEAAKPVGGRVSNAIAMGKDKATALVSSAKEAYTGLNEKDNPTLGKVAGVLNTGVEKAKAFYNSDKKTEELKKLYRTKVGEFEILVKEMNETGITESITGKFKTFQSTLETLAISAQGKADELVNKPEVKKLVDGLLDTVTSFRTKIIAEGGKYLNMEGAKNPDGTPVDNKAEGIKGHIRNLGGSMGGKLVDTYDSIVSKKKSIKELAKTAKEELNKSALGKKMTGFWDYEKYKDVYLPGRDEPVITADGLRAGDYFNSEGEQINSVDDIEGLVKDKDGQVVVSSDQVEKLVVYEKSKNKFVILSHIKKIFKGLVAIQKFGNKITRFNLKAVWGAYKFMGRTVGRMLGLYTQPRDVYVEGESAPRLTTYGFKNGDYSDLETGKTLKNHEDIVGPVVDTDGQVLLAEADLEKLAIYEPFLSKMNPLKLVKWLAKKAAGLAISATKTGFEVSKFLLKGIWGAVKRVGRFAGKVAGALGFRMQPVDLYVAGDTTPRLLAMKMKKGEYADAKTGHIINYPGDIAGAVVDITDPDKNIILSAEDFAAGVYTNKGVRINPKGSTLGGISTRLAKFFGVKSKLKIKDKRGIARSLKSGPSTSEEAQVKSAETLTGISGLLKGIATKMGVSTSKKDRVVKRLGKTGEVSKTIKPEAKGAVKKAEEGLSLSAKSLLPLITELALPVLGIMGAAAAGLGIGTIIGKKVSGDIGDGVDALKRWTGSESPEEELNRITLGPEQNSPENVKRAKVLRSQLMSTPEGRKKLTGDPNGKLPASSLPERDPNAKAGGGALSPIRPAIAPSKGGSIFGGNANAGEVPQGGPPTIDGEIKPTATGGGASTQDAGAKGSVGSLPAATGPISDGRNAGSFMKVKNGVKTAGVNPQFYDQFKGAVDEYGEATGKKVVMTDGYRTYADQVAMKAKYGARAATPGYSPHEAGTAGGLAIDADSKALNEMDKMGILRKYGVTRPVGGEPWHVEPIGILGKVAQYKNNPEAANEAIKSGIGKGGGGLGADPSSKKYTRDYQNAVSVFTAPSSPTSPETDALKTNPTKPVGGTPGYFPSAPKGSENGTSHGQGASPDTEGKQTSSTAVAGGADTNNETDPRKIIEAAAKTVGVDAGMMKMIGALESGMGKNTGKATTSSASGMMQITSGTMREMLKKYGSKYGYDINTSTSDLKASALMAAHYVKEISATLPKGAGARDVYLAYMLGPGGSKSLRNALASDPNAIAADVLPAAAAANKPIFYDKGAPRTVVELQKLIDSKMGTASTQYGIAIPASDMSGSSPKVADTNYNQTPMGNGVASVSPISSRTKPPVQQQSLGQYSQVGFTQPVPAQRQSGGDDLSRGSSSNLINAGMFKQTETLLGEQLKVQLQILALIKQLSEETPIVEGGGDNNQQPSNPHPQRSNKEPVRDTGKYTPPAPPISMTRRFAT